MSMSSSSALFCSNMDDSTLCNYGWKIARENPQIAVRFARGGKMRTVGALFDEVSSACQFPYYFGENWAAFKECLADLSWLNSSGFLLILTRADEVLVDDPADMGAFVRAVRAAIKAYNEQLMLPADLRKEEKERAFHVIVNSNSSDPKNVSKILNGIGLEVSNIPL